MAFFSFLQLLRHNDLETIWASVAIFFLMLLMMFFCHLFSGLTYCTITSPRKNHVTPGWFTKNLSVACSMVQPLYKVSRSYTLGDRCASQLMPCVKLYVRYLDNREGCKRSKDTTKTRRVQQNSLSVIISIGLYSLSQFPGSPAWANKFLKVKPHWFTGLPLVHGVLPFWRTRWKPATYYCDHFKAVFFFYT